MARRLQYDVAELFRLWNDTERTRDEVARTLGLTETQLTAVARRHGLPARGRRRRCFTLVDPTPEEIAERAAACRERHMAARRSEDVGNTHSKTSKWRRGICSPR